MAYQQPPYSPASVDSDDYHFGSLSKLEEQSLLIHDESPSDFSSPPPSPKSTEPPRSTAFLDGVRGVAALLVFLHHFAPQFYVEEQNRGFGQRDPITGVTWRHFASFPYVRLFYSGGDAAVALFFVLSGYVLSIAPLRRIINTVREGGGSREEWRSIAKSIVSAAVRRPIRLYLPVFLAAITFAVLRHTPVGPSLASTVGLQSSIGAEISSCIHEFVKFFNPFQLHGINREWFAYGVVLWTIPIELKGSMLVFLLTGLYAFASQSRFYRRLYFLQLITLCTVLLFINQWTMSLFVAGLILAVCDIRGLHLSSLPLQLPLLNRRRHSSNGSSALFRLFTRLLNHTILVFGGYLLSQPAHRSTITNSLHTPGWRFLTTLIPRTYLTENGDITWFDPEYSRFWTSIGGMLTLYALLNITWCQRVFASRIPQYLGKVSFALYFTHVPVLMITTHSVLRSMGQWTGEPMGEFWYDNKLYLSEWGTMGLTPRYLGCLTVESVICLLVAHAATILFDRPALRLSKWVAKVLGLSSSNTKGQPAWSKGTPVEKSIEWSEKDKGRWLA